MPSPGGKTSDRLIFFVNGVRVSDDNVNPETTLIDYLRTKLRLTGTKLGCHEGGCGACTVMVSRYDDQEERIHHYAVNACLYPICAAHGQAITTVEGIGSSRDLHPIQRKMAEAHGSQCGFCTPGFVMSMYALMRNNPNPTQEEVESAFEGNLCRCTGYRSILDGMRAFTTPACGMGDKCCKNNKEPCGGDNGQDTESSTVTANGTAENGVSNGFDVVKDATQDFVFPGELKVHHDQFSKMAVFQGPRVTWYRPPDLAELLRMKAEHPHAKLVNGNTEVGVEVKFKNQQYPVIVAPTLVHELRLVTKHEDGIELGGSVTLTKLDEVMKEAVKELTEYQTKLFAAIREMLRWFAGHQIRNVSAIAGNITTASPISDLNPLFMAANCRVNLASQGESRSVVMDENFFTGYRKTMLEKDEIVLSIIIPFTKENEYFYGYKQAHRREDDIAIVNAGMLVRFHPGTDVVDYLSLSYGGMAPTTVKALRACNNAVGRYWDESLLTDVCHWLEEDLPLDGGAPGGSVMYRRTLTTSFFYKFYLSVTRDLHKDGIIPSGIPESHVTATEYYHHRESVSSQVYEMNESRPGPVGRPVVHQSAYKQVTGEAVYTNDIRPFEGELHLCLVQSSKAHARIVSVDASRALAVPGVKAYVDHTDVPGENSTYVIFDDEEIFASKKVQCMGQTIGAIAAVDEATARRAAKLVQVQYEELPVLVTIEDAIAADSYLFDPLVVQSGDLEAGFNSADVIIEGTQRMRGQEHFYMEPHGVIAVPTEDGGMELFASAQCPTSVQMSVVRALGCPANHVVSKVKRIGGGFGGKESRFSLVVQPCAVAAQKLGVPVRCILDRDEDMAITGTRHPFLGKYKIGVKSDGRIVAAECDIYSNGGWSKDLSIAVMERAVLHITNAYHIPNIRVTGHVTRTNISSCTAFRGFGSPQAMLVCESYMDDIAVKLGLPVDKVREVNLFREGDMTLYNTKLEGVNIEKCWTDCMEQSRYDTRKREVENFNRDNKWKKRGLAVLPTMFGIAFTRVTMNQSGALINIYKDGSVLLAHGGIEMGQGVHTKMIQVASQVLGIPMSKIHVNETNTAVVPNTSATAASLGSDLNGMAVKDACEKIINRIDHIRITNPKSSWEEWIMLAYTQRISLSATGFYRTPGLGYDFGTNTGRPFNYFTVGVACSEVEIDCLTGDHKVLRTDIVMDVGDSLNPSIDIGQIEGAFVQGYGLFMLEELRHSPSGFLLTRGPGMYKIPAAGDIPAEFNVTLLKNVPNPSAIYSSKAIGEPPLFLAASVYYAVKSAIRAYQAENGASPDFHLLSPASAENIRMACQDRFTEQFTDKTAPCNPWDVVA